MRMSILGVMVAAALFATPSNTVVAESLCHKLTAAQAAEVERHGALTPDCVLLPKDYQFSRPADGTPNFCSQWIGLWTGGKWDRVWPGALAVTKIRSHDGDSCLADVIVAWGLWGTEPYSWEKNAPSYEYATATITPRGLSVNESIRGDRHSYVATQEGVQGKIVRGTVSATTIFSQTTTVGRSSQGS